MPTPVDLALASLLPHVSFPPEELQRLTSSLLTQSRVRAPRLKADEEVARTFACAHLACERLQNRLSLEIGRELRPPCPPKVYTRLKGFLAGIVGTSQQASSPAASSQPLGGLRKPENPRGGAGAIRNGRTTSSADVTRTPTRTTTTTPSATTPTAITPTVTTTTTTPITARKREIAEAEGGVNYDSEGIPTFASPLLARLHKACKVSASVAERVRVGAVQVVKEIASRRKKSDAETGSASKRRRGGRTTAAAATTSQTVAPVDASPAQQGPVVPVSRWPALLVALFLCLVAKTRECEVDAAAMGKMRQRAVEAVGEFLTQNGTQIPEAGAAHASDGLDRMVAFYLLEAGDCGWLDMEWCQDISAIGDIEVDDEEDEEGEEEDTPVKPRRRPAKTPLRREEKHGGRKDLGNGFGPAGLLPGLGTMFQPAIDWLSDERREQYGHWQQEILDRIATIEQQA